MFSKEFWIDRLSERTTWTAIGIIAGIAGYKFSPEQWSSIVDAGTAIATVFLVFYHKSQPENDPQKITEKAFPEKEYTSVKRGTGKDVR